MKMRPSRVLAKLRAGKVVSCVKSNLSDPRVIEIAALSGFDCVWVCMEHVPNTLHDVENQIRAAKMFDVDTVVRVPRGSYSDLIRPLEALQRMCLGPNPPTAIMASFDSMAELIYLLLGRLGLRVPEDISLIGFGGTWREGAVVRQLTSVTVDEAELGRHAVEMLHEMRSGERPIDDIEEIVMPLNLSDGQTLGHKAATAGRENSRVRETHHE